MKKQYISIYSAKLLKEVGYSPMVLFYPIIWIIGSNKEYNFLNKNNKDMNLKIFGKQFGEGNIYFLSDPHF